MFWRVVPVSVTEYHWVLVQLSTTMENKTKIQKIHINILKLRKRIVWRVYFESFHHSMKVRIFLFFSTRFRLFLSSNMEFPLPGWSKIRTRSLMWWQHCTFSRSLNLLVVICRNMEDTYWFLFFKTKKLERYFHILINSDTIWYKLCKRVSSSNLLSPLIIIGK